MAELRAAQKSMIQGNRVFAVLTPQVVQVIEADTVAAQAATLQSGEAAVVSGDRHATRSAGICKCSQA